MSNTISQIDEYIDSLTDWRGQQIAQLRQLIHAACPDISEQWKWNVPVYSGRKMICATSAFKDHVKMNFFQGSQLTDFQHLFNSGLDSKSHRSINFVEHDVINQPELTKVLQAAYQLDQAKK